MSGSPCPTCAGTGVTADGDPCFCQWDPPKKPRVRRHYADKLTPTDLQALGYTRPARRLKREPPRLPRTDNDRIICPSCGGTGARALTDTDRQDIALSDNPEAATNDLSNCRTCYGTRSVSSLWASWRKEQARR